MDAHLLRQAALFGPEFVDKLITMDAMLKGIARTTREAMDAEPSDYVLAPPEDTSPTPHALPTP